MPDATHIVCPECDGVNRIPADRNPDDANCGKCHQKLFEHHPLSLDASRFDRHIARSDVPILVDFWASWCGPCQMMAPEFEKAAALLEPKIRLAKVNTEDNPTLSARYGIRSIPTLVLFRNGRELTRQSGALPAQQLINWVQQSL